MLDGGLIANLTLALFVAFIGGTVASRLGQSAMIGYIVGGTVIGPYTPGLIADQAAVEALAEVGIIFLLFTVGIQLSVRDLLQAGRTASIGGAIQVLAMIGVGTAIGLALGWPLIEGLFFGAVISNSSSTVLGKVLAERGETQSEHGQLGLAWSTVQDLSTILLVVILSALASGAESGPLDVLIAAGKVIVLLAILIPVGLYFIPWLLERVLLLRTREMFILAVAFVALGTAFLASLFGVSLALGAFLAGLMVGETDLSHQAFREVSPLRDVFTGLFFVSVGMLVDPLFIVTATPLVLLAAVLIVVVKGMAIAGIAYALRVPPRTATLTGVGLAQSAEFSFLLARVGSDLGAVPANIFNLMLVGSVVSIVLAPKLHEIGQPLARRVGRQLLRDEATGTAAAGDLGESQTEEPLGRRRFAVICGYGRVGAIVAEALERRGFQYVVIEEDPRIARQVRARGIRALVGAADNVSLLERAEISSARVLVVAIPDPVATRLIVEYARELSPTVDIVARTQSVDEMRQLRERGVREAVVGEVELALEITRHTLSRFGVSGTELQQIVRRLRERLGNDAGQ